MAAGEQPEKRARGRPSTRDKDGFTPHERILRTAIFEAIAVAQSEGRKPTCNDVRRLLEGRGLGKQAKTRIMTVVRMCGLQSIWASRGAQLRAYIDRYCTPGLSWSQHLTQLHRDRRLRLQRAALEHPDQAEAVLDEDNAGLKRVLKNSGMAAPIWPGPARATLERVTGKRSGPGSEFDRRKALLREKLAERKAEREEEARRTAENNEWLISTGQKPHPPMHDLEEAWRKHRAAQRQANDRGKGRDEIQVDADGVQVDEKRNRIPPQDPSPWDLEHQARRQREGW